MCGPDHMIYITDLDDKREKHAILYEITSVVVIIGICILALVKIQLFQLIITLTLILSVIWGFNVIKESMDTGLDKKYNTVWEYTDDINLNEDTFDLEFKFVNSENAVVNFKYMVDKGFKSYHTHDGQVRWKAKTIVDIDDKSELKIVTIGLSYDKAKEYLGIIKKNSLIRGGDRHDTVTSKTNVC